MKMMKADNHPKNREGTVMLHHARKHDARALSRCSRYCVGRESSSIPTLVCGAHAV
jgi:hypothetical protein